MAINLNTDGTYNLCKHGEPFKKVRRWQNVPSPVLDYWFDLPIKVEPIAVNKVDKTTKANPYLSLKAKTCVAAITPFLAVFALMSIYGSYCEKQMKNDEIRIDLENATQQPIQSLTVCIGNQTAQSLINNVTKQATFGFKTTPDEGVSVERPELSYKPYPLKKFQTLDGRFGVCFDLATRKGDDFDTVRGTYFLTTNKENQVLDVNFVPKDMGDVTTAVKIFDAQLRTNITEASRAAPSRAVYALKL